MEDGSVTAADNLPISNSACSSFMLNATKCITVKRKVRFKP